MEVASSNVDEIVTVLRELNDGNLDLDRNQKLTDDLPVKKGKKRTAQQKTQLNEPAVSKKKVKKKSVAAEKSMKDVMMDLNFSHDLGTWVQCSSCAKWRYLKDVQEPASLSFQNAWFCSMNDDITRNSCDAPEEDFPRKEYGDIKFAPGSLVKARLCGFPWWPAIVEYDPGEEKYVWFKSVDSDSPSHYHVTFLGEPVSRSWVSCSEVRPYNELESENTKPLGEKISRCLNEAEIQAKEALPLSLKERIQRFSFANRYKGKWRRRSIKTSPLSSRDNSDSSEYGGHRKQKKMQRMNSDEKKLMEMIQDLDSLSSFDSDMFGFSDHEEPDNPETEESVVKKESEFFGHKFCKEQNNKNSRSEKSSITLDNKNTFGDSLSSSGKSDLIPKKKKSKVKKEGSFAPPLKAEISEEISKEKSKKLKKKKGVPFETVTETSSNDSDFRQKIEANKNQFMSKKVVDKSSGNSSAVSDSGNNIDSFKAKTFAVFKHKKTKLNYTYPLVPENSVKAKKKRKVLDNLTPKKKAPISSYDDSIESVVQNCRCFLNDESDTAHDFPSEVKDNEGLEISAGSDYDITTAGYSNDILITDGTQQPSEAVHLAIANGTHAAQTCEMAVTKDCENTENDGKTSKENCFRKFLETKKSKLAISTTDVGEVSSRALNETNTCAVERSEVGENITEGKHLDTETEELSALDTETKTQETISENAGLDDENETVTTVATSNNKNDENETVTTVATSNNKNGENQTVTAVATSNDKNDENYRREEPKIEFVPEKNPGKKSPREQKIDAEGSKDGKQKTKKKFFAPIRKD